MKNFKNILFVFLLFVGSYSVSFSQTEAEKETNIVNLSISFQQNRYTNSEKAKQDIEKAIEIARTMKSKKKLVSTSILLGEYYDDNNNFNKAFSLYTEAEQLATKVNDIEGLALCN